MMRTPLLAAAVLSALAGSYGTVAAPAGKGDPPGLVLIPAGKVVVGTPREEIQSILDKSPPFGSPLVAESPPETIEIPAFWIQVNEVTNEQYEVFVRATKRRPPFHWFKGDIIEISNEWLRANPGGRFDAGTWWDVEWEKREWEVPADLRRVPVVNVSFSDAEAYARWAGLRLPSREEFLRAGREDTTKTFPWGAKWESSLCANSENVAKKRGAGVLPRIGTHPGGKSPSGVYDLCGSVWEWTTSRNVEPKGYKPFEVKRSGQAAESIEGRFSSAERLIVGGSFRSALPHFVCRLPARNGAPPETRLDEIGFRCARSEKPGVDVARWSVERELNLASLGDASIAAERAIVFERWERLESGPAEASGNSSPGRAGIAVSGAPAKAPAPRSEEVAGYAVIRKYETILLAPVAGLPYLTPTELERASREHPVPLALLYTDRALVEPALEPGLYTVSYRHEGASSLGAARPKADEKGKEKGKESAESTGAKEGSEAPPPPAIEETLAKWVDPKKRSLVFRDRTGEIVAAIQTDADLPLKDVRAGAETGTATLDPEEDRIAFQFPILYKLGEKKAFLVPLALKFEKGTCSLPWNK